MRRFEDDDARRALEIPGPDANRDVVLAVGGDADLLPDAGELPGGILHDPVRRHRLVAVVPGRPERDGRIRLDAGDAAADDEELVADGEALGEVRILREQVFGVPDLEHRGHEIEAPLGGCGLDAVEMLEVFRVHQREVAEVRILEEDGVESEASPNGP